MDNLTYPNDTLNWTTNETYKYLNSTKDEEASAPLWVTRSAIWVIGAFFLALLIVLTIAGNLLVIVGVACSPRLRSPTYSFIVNLAVADLLLGIAVLPISAARELFDYQFSKLF